MLRTHKAGKDPWGCVGWGLVSRNRRGPAMHPRLVSEGRGPHLGAQQPSWARVGRANSLLSSTAALVWGLGGSLPPASLDLPSLPPMPLGTTWFGGGLEGRGSAWELSRFPSPSGPGDRPPPLSHSSGRVPPTCLS